jgi:hypothetical protein
MITFPYFEYICLESGTEKYIRNRGTLSYLLYRITRDLTYDFFHSGPTREQVEARVKKVISKVTGYPVEQV